MTSSANITRGFTLIEVVVSLAIAGIIVAYLALFISAPTDAYMMTSSRSRLSTEATTIHRWLTDDLSTALPESIRIQRTGPLVFLELLAVTDAARYRTAGTSTPPSPNRELAFSVADSQFSTLGQFSRITHPLSSQSYRLVVGHTGTAGSNAWNSDAVITPAGTRIQIRNGSVPGEDDVQLSPAMRFDHDAANHLAYLVSGPVLYECDEAAKTLTRYQGYTPDLSVGGRRSLATQISVVSRIISHCDFDFSPRGAMPSVVAATIALSANGERIDIWTQSTAMERP